MGDPISMIAIGSAVAGVAGAGVSAAGSYNAMQAQSANAAYQAQVAQNNAKIAAMNETLEIQSGEQAAAIGALKTRAAVGNIKAAQAGAGIDVNRGSAVDVRAGATEVGALDALTIRSNYARKAYGYATAATSDIAQAGLFTAESEQAAAAGPLAATGSLLSGISTAGSKFAQFQTKAPVDASVP
jgi:hypothetical protein